MILFDNVIKILAFADFYTAIIVNVELINACFIGTTLVDID